MKIEKMSPRFYVAKAALFVALAVITPLLLENSEKYSFICFFQVGILSFLAGLNIAKAAYMRRPR